MSERPETMPAMARTKAEGTKKKLARANKNARARKLGAINSRGWARSELRKLDRFRKTKNLSRDKAVKLLALEALSALEGKAV